MGSKVRCPACGAKNDAASYRCRMCTAVINAEAARPTEEPASAEVAPMDDHFDAGVIDRQLQPTRSKFGDDSGGLAARLAAARAAKAANQTMPAAPADPGAPAADSADLSTGALPAGPATAGWSNDVVSGPLPHLHPRPHRRLGPARPTNPSYRSTSPRCRRATRPPPRPPSNTRPSPSTRTRCSAT